MSRAHLQLLFIPLLLLALYWTQQQWRYQRAIARGDAAAATAIWPANAEGWRLLSASLIFTDAHAADSAARRAIADDREDWHNWAALAQVQVETGDLAAARSSMAQMSQRVVGYEPNWRYANLLLLTGDTSGFWPQAEKALSFAPGGEISSAFQQIWLAAGLNTAVFDQAVRAAQARAVDPAQPERLAQSAIQFLLDQNQLAAATPWWQSLLAHPLNSGQKNDLRPLGLRYLDLLAEAGAPDAATQLSTALSSGLFTSVSDALPWNICTNCGPWASYTNGAMDFNFQGDQQDTLTLARRWLILQPATTYRLAFKSVADPAAGVALKVVALPSGARLAPEDMLTLNASGTPSAQPSFTTSAAPAPYQLQVVYQRPLGTMPLKADVQLDAISVSPIK
ncbi:MAG TPA: hypothetical protein VN709_09830 [Terriglobales bacterium]|nr:hypothetical protein [Terriglobales bacterium]